MKHLVILDTHALIYRSHYALIKNPIVNSKGMNISAIHGFSSYLMRLMRKYKDSTFVATFDSNEPTFRKVMYPDYKANRNSMDKDLRIQIPYIQKFIELLGLKCFRESGFEADDIIGLFCKYATDNDIHAKIVSKDKDLMQLVNDHVNMLSPVPGPKIKIIGRQEVLEKMNVEPEMILTYLALVGDKADNIPGIRGVGPKTAEKIIMHGYRVEELIKDPFVLQDTELRSIIIDGMEDLVLSYSLVKLSDDIDMDVSNELLEGTNVDYNGIVEFFKDTEIVGSQTRSLDIIYANQS